MDGLSRVNGKFTDFTVTLTNDEKDITKSSVNVIIKAASINTGIPARDTHLRSADFFDAEKYPEITFQSKRIEKKGKQLFALGTFTMHGVSKEITLPFQVTGVKQRPGCQKNESWLFGPHCAQPQRLRSKLDSPEGSKLRWRQRRDRDQSDYEGDRC